MSLDPDHTSSGEDEHTSHERGRIAVGALALLLGVVYGVLAWTGGLRLGGLARPGAALFPVLISGFIVVTSLGVIVSGAASIKAESGKRAWRLPDWSGGRRGPRAWLGRNARALAFLALLTGYGIALPLLGFAASSLVMLILGTALVGWPRRWYLVPIYSALTVGVLYYIFGQLLGVRLP